MMKFSDNYIFSESDFDTFGNILPSKVLDVFQILAGNHASQLGIGFHSMLDRHLLWVVTQIKYQVCADIAPGQQVTGITWPLPPTRHGFERQYLICDSDGNILIKGTSNWALIDTETRHLASVSDVYPEGEHCTDRNFDEKIRRLRDFDAVGETFEICPDESTIDRNGHVNNTNYAEFVRAALGCFGGKIDTFQIDFINEVMCHQKLYIQHAVSGTTTLVKGLSDDDKRMFTCSITLK
ncbi:MAG: hypothetical protein J6L81_00855 [Clostridia bacterium]|nr:hypothetical protein [Clostridia bacterium]